MRTPSSTIPNPASRVGFCTCGVPLVEHLDERGADISCAGARDQWLARIDARDALHADAVNLLATSVNLRFGRAVTGDPKCALSPDEHVVAQAVAAGALNGMRPPMVSLARDRAVAAAHRDFERVAGPLTPRAAAQMRLVVLAAIDEHQNVLQGLATLTPREHQDIEIAELRGGGR